MTSRMYRLFGILFLAAISWSLLSEIPGYLAERNWVGLTLNSLSYAFLGSIFSIFLIRIAKQIIWCRKGHTWVEHPPVYKKDGKLKWHGYEDCARCFQHKDSYDKEQAERKHECPSCRTHIPW